MTAAFLSLACVGLSLWERRRVCRAKAGLSLAVVETHRLAVLSRPVEQDNLVLVDLTERRYVARARRVMSVVGSE